MDEWMPLYLTVFDHPKTVRMSRLLGISGVTLVGHLAALWAYCRRYAPNGSLASLGEDVIEAAARWEGERGAFVMAATDAGFFDEGGDGLSLHNWYDRAGKMLEKMEEERKRSARRRAEEKAQRTGDQWPTGGRPAVGRRSATGREGEGRAEPGQELSSEIPKSGISLSSPASAAASRRSS